MTIISPLGQLAIVLTRADEQDRAAARQIEDAADQAAMKDANERVSQLRAAADADEKTAFASGIADMAGSACSIGAAFLSAPTSPSSSTTVPSTAAPPTGWNAAFSAGGIALPAAGKLVAGVYKGEADRDNSEAARFEAQSQADNRRYDRAQSDEQAANDAIQKVEQFAEQAQQAENATLLAAATFRA
jgi:hypothetical protein